MTNDEWNECDDALMMLDALKRTLPSKSYTALKPILWRYLLACCDRISELIPQKALQAGLEGAEQYLDGKIGYNELNCFDWHAEAECFSLDYHGVTIAGETPIAGISGLSKMTRAEALHLATKAAYFANGAMKGIAPRKRSVRYSEFCCPILLRKFIPASFDH